MQKGILYWSPLHRYVEQERNGRLTIVTEIAEGNEPSLTNLTAFFKAIHEPHRLGILNILSCADEALLSVQIEDEMRRRSMGVTQSTISFHLGRLKQAGVLTRTGRGVNAYWAIETEKWDRLMAWLQELSSTRRKRLKP